MKLLYVQFFSGCSWKRKFENANFFPLSRVTVWVSHFRELEYSLNYRRTKIIDIIKQSPCSSDPCPNELTCIAKYEDDDYQCACPLGYAGKHCDTGNPKIDLKQLVKRHMYFITFSSFRGIHFYSDLGFSYVLNGKRRSSNTALN